MPIAAEWHLLGSGVEEKGGPACMAIEIGILVACMGSMRVT